MTPDRTYSRTAATGARLLITAVGVGAIAVEVIDLVRFAASGTDGASIPLFGLSASPWVSMALHATTVALASALALLAAWRGSRRSGTLALAGALAVFALLKVHFTMLVLGVVLEGTAASAFRFTAIALRPDRLGGFLRLAFPVLLIAFAQRFPTPLRADDVRAAFPVLGSHTDAVLRRLLRPRTLGAAGLVVVLAWYALQPFRSSQAVFVEVGSTAIGIHWIIEQLAFMLMLGGTMAGWVLAATYFGLQLRGANADGKRRIRWVGFGIVVVATVALTGFAVELFRVGATESATGWVGSVVGGPMAIANLVFLICLAIAVFFGGAFDPGLVLEKSTLYGALVVVLTFLFAGTEELVSNLMVERLGASGGLATWFAAGVVALVVMPLHQRLQRFLDDVQAREEAAGMEGRRNRGTSADPRQPSRSTS